MAQLPPIEVLARSNDLQYRILAPEFFIFQGRDGDVEDRKNQIVPAKLGFASQKRFEFESAVMTAQRAGRDDRDEKDRLRNALGDLFLPQGPERNRGLVLPYAKVSLGTSELGAQLALNRVPQRRQSAPGA